MRLRRAVPALLKTGWKDAVAYRGELVVWMLTMTLPLIMLALFRAVAQEGSLGGFDAAAFTAYYLATLLVRQLASSWVAWEMNREIREGVLSMRLLRPIHPLWGYFCASLAAAPVRAIISVPITVGMLWAFGGGGITHDPLVVGVFLLSLVLAFALSFAISALTGTLAFYTESALGIWQVYIGLFALFSGYLVPLALFPTWFQRLAAWTPFPYVLGVPVEILLGKHAHTAALRLCAIQATYASLGLVALVALWRRGARRFAAYGA